MAVASCLNISGNNQRAVVRNTGTGIRNDGICIQLAQSSNRNFRPLIAGNHFIDGVAAVNDAEFAGFVGFTKIDSNQRTLIFGTVGQAQSAEFKCAAASDRRR